MPNLGGWELLVLLAVLILLFGASKLPTAARSIGQSMRIFKAEARGLRSDDEETGQGGRQAPQQQPSNPPEIGQPQQTLPPSGPAAGTPVEEPHRRHNTGR